MLFSEKLASLVLIFWGISTHSLRWSRLAGYGTRTTWTTRSRDRGTVTAALDAVTAARARGGRQEQSRPSQWKRSLEISDGVRAAGEGKDTGHHRGRGVAIGAVAVEETAGASRASPARLPPRTRPRDGRGTAAALRPISILSSQTKVTRGPLGHRRGRGRAKKPAGAIGFAVASDAGGRPRAAKPAAGTLPRTKSWGRRRGRDCTMITGAAIAIPWGSRGSATDGEADNMAVELPPGL